MGENFDEQKDLTLEECALLLASQKTTAEESKENGTKLHSNFTKQLQGLILE